MTDDQELEQLFEEEEAKESEGKKKSGRPKGLKNAIDYDNPRTPFEALRFKLNLSVKEWANRNEIAEISLRQNEIGKTLPSVDLAKRMQDEARKCGIAVTLDELYQNVVPLGEDYILSLQRKEKRLLKQNKMLKRWQEKREKEDQLRKERLEQFKIRHKEEKKKEMEIRKEKREAFIQKLRNNREIEKELRMEESQSIEQNNEV